MRRGTAEVDVLRGLPGRIGVERLGNGLTVCLLENRQAPLVTTALWYRAGTRDEARGQGGTAHFLEHMMFKGSPHYGPGEIDRRTQALGGANNAFTSHDATAYYFNFAADRWGEALAIEADRMAGLLLDAEEVASERQVILEEIAMYDSEPWDALEMAVQRRLFGGHVYGWPVLGTAAELEAIGAAELAAFHGRYYRPDNAVLVVGGDLGPDALAAVERALGGQPAAGRGRTPVAEPTYPTELVRLERRKGEVPRLLLALPAPPGGHPDHAPLHLLATLLGSGRTSRLHRALVDEGQLCVWASADVSESQGPGQLTLAAEVVPGATPAQVEAELLRQLALLAAEPPAEGEVARAKQLALADWVFGHERVHQQALAAGFALALFDLDHLERELERLAAVGAERLLETADRYLRPERGGVLGWSLPRSA
ncbi:MAG TPA: pitrilysin family protein [Thermoanaerobaculia bacterium]|nr:pitrilysin family protein [Thermoanaerobaculia bacterium]